MSAGSVRKIRVRVTEYSAPVADAKPSHTWRVTHVAGGAFRTESCFTEGEALAKLLTGRAAIEQLIDGKWLVVHVSENATE